MTPALQARIDALRASNPYLAGLAPPEPPQADPKGDLGVPLPVVEKNNDLTIDSDPFAGIATPVLSSDPFAGIASPVTSLPPDVTHSAENGQLPRRAPPERVTTPAADVTSFERPILDRMAIEAGKGAASSAIATTGGMLSGAAFKGMVDPAAHKRAVTGFQNVPFMSEDELKGFIEQTKREAGPYMARLMHRSAIAVRRGAMPMDQALASFGNVQLGVPEDSRLYKAGEAVKGVAQAERLAPAPGWEESWTRWGGEALGSLAPFLVVGAATGPLGPLGSVAATAAAGAASSTDEAVTRAKTAGATREQILQAANLGSLPGLLEAAPIEVLLERVPTPRLPGVLGAIATIAMKAGAEGTQEGVTQAIQNVIEKSVYDPDQAIMEGVPQAAGAGAFAGGVVGGVTEAGRGALRRPAPPAPVPDATPQLPPPPSVATVATVADPPAPEAVPPVPPTIPVENAPKAPIPGQKQPTLDSDDAVLAAAGVHPDDIAEMNAAERAAAAQEARDQGVRAPAIISAPSNEGEKINFPSEDTPSDTPVPAAQPSTKTATNIPANIPPPAPIAPTAAPWSPDMAEGITANAPGVTQMPADPFEGIARPAETSETLRNTSESVSASTTLADLGLKLSEVAKGRFKAVDEAGRDAGEVWLKSSVGGPQNEVADVRVPERMRRKGVASAMYDAIEAQTGEQIVPSDNLTHEAFLFWSKRRPEAVAGSLHHYRDQLIGKRVRALGKFPGTITAVGNDQARVKLDSGGGQGMTRAELIEQGVLPPVDAEDTPPSEAQQPSAPQPQDTWQAIVDDLDARGAPDADYRNILSTGSKDRLKKGETWRGRVVDFIATAKGREQAPEPVAPAAADPFEGIATPANVAAQENLAPPKSQDTARAGQMDLVDMARKPREQLSVRGGGKRKPSRAQTEAALTAIIRKVAGPDVAIEFHARMQTQNASAMRPWGLKGSTEVAGSHNRLAALIKISLAPGLDRENTALHESWHHIEDLMTRPERALFKKEMPRLRGIAQRSEEATPAEAAKWSDAEVLATAFAAYAQGRSNGMHIGVRRFFDKLARILREFRNWLHGHGFRTFEDVADLALAEKIHPRGAERDAQIGAGLEEQLAIDPNSTPFKRWFGKSKVVDAKGKPLVVYKGMMDPTDEAGIPREIIQRDSDFPAFNRGEAGFKIAGFFASDPAVASRFATHGEDSAGAIFPVYLSLQQPYVVDATGEKAGNIQFGPSGQAFRDAMRSDQYDGAVIRNTADEGTIFVAKRPEQIKSVFNRGTFDPNDPRISLLPAWHGSPHRFDKFSLDKIGTGEGAQAYGHGLYFSSKREIAEHYRDALSRGVLEVEPVTDAERIIAKALREFVDELGYLPPRREIEMDIINNIDAEMNDMTMGDLFTAFDNMEKRAPSGALYRVEIPEDDTMLLWDRPLSEQPEKVKAALASIDDSVVNAWRTNGAWEHVKAENLYRHLTDYRDGGQKAASEALHAAGISGIKYLDGSSRNTGLRILSPKDSVHGKWVVGYAPNGPNTYFESEAEARAYMAAEEAKQAYNFVVFDDAAIEITEQLKPGRRRPVKNPNAAFDIPEDRKRIAKFLNAIPFLGIDTTDTAIRAKLQDRMIDMRKIQGAIEDRQGMPLAEHYNVDMAESLYYGRSGVDMMKLRQKVVDPLADRMQRLGINRALLDNFMYAMHARERNASIRQIDPANDAGSGMTDDEARDALHAIQQSGRRQEYMELANRVYVMNASTRQRLLTSGLISQDQFDEWSTKWRYYVPLRGFENDPESAADIYGNAGSGFSVKGPEAHRALGRRSVADSPLAYAINQAKMSIIRAEKNRVGKTLLRTVEAYPNKELWEIDRGTWGRRVSKETGEVERYPISPTATKNDPDVITVKVGGKQRFIRIKNERLLAGLKMAGAEQMGPVVQVFAKLNRYLSTMSTSLNPEFVVSNAFRDLTTALVHLGEENVDGLRSKVVRDLPQAARGIWGGLGGAEATAWQKHFKEYSEAGGRISFFNVESLEEEKNAIDAAFKRGNIRRAGAAVIEHIDRMNNSVENAARLATYVNLRKSGYTKAQAASVARELTVNFNRKGEWGPYLNAFYLFYNASIQGTTRMAQALARSRKVQASAAIMAVLAGLVDQMNALLAGDDDDEMNFWDKVPEHEKLRNLIIMWPDGSGRMTKIPMPYGYNIFTTAGTQVSAMLRGKTSATEAAANIAGALGAAVSPIGFGPTPAQLIAPSAFDPIVQMAENKNWSGIPIYPKTFDEDVPDSESSFSGVNPVFKAAAKGLNRLGGGDEYGAAEGAGGYLDVSPETLEVVGNFVAGGAGAFVMRIGKFTAKAWNGEALEPNDMPFVRRLHDQVGSFIDRNVYYDIWERVDHINKRVVGNEKDGDIETADGLRQSYPIEADPEVVDAFKYAEKHLAKLRKEKRGLENDEGVARPQYRAERDRIEEEMQTIMREARTAWERRRQADEAGR